MTFGVLGINRKRFEIFYKTIKIHLFSCLSLEYLAWVDWY